MLFHLISFNLSLHVILFATLQLLPCTSRELYLPKESTFLGICLCIACSVLSPEDLCALQPLLFKLELLGLQISDPVNTP